MQGCLAVFCYSRKRRIRKVWGLVWDIGIRPWMLLTLRGMWGGLPCWSHLANTGAWIQSLVGKASVPAGIETPATQLRPTLEP